jgi:predicted nucleic acid-binding protein
LRSVVIADAGPLIALSRIDALDLLRGLFGQVLVTEEVRDEALPAADYPGKAFIAQGFEAGWLVCPGPFETSWQPTNPGLDAGERSAIAAAMQMPGCLLIIDDRAGRAEAKSHQVAIIGTAAVIGLAKLQGLIPAARPVLERLQPAGYFIHPRIIEAVLQDVGE